jgi:hypothetical protein
MAKSITWRMDATILGIALLIIADASSFWSANNPSFFTVRHFTTESEEKAQTTKTDIRAGGGKATIETVIVGYGAVLVTRSWWPLASALSYMAVDWVWYEWAMQHPHANTTGIAQQEGY